MKKKKQVVAIISLLVMLAIVLGSWVMVKYDRVKAEERVSGTSDVREAAEDERDIPEEPPSNLNQLDLAGDFNRVSDSEIFTGDGTWKNTVQITPPIAKKTGAIWYNIPVSLKEPFSGQFEVYLGKNEKYDVENPYSWMKDGITFTLQNSQEKINAIGSSSTGFGASGNYNPVPSGDFIKNAISIGIGASGISKSYNLGYFNFGIPEEGRGFVPDYPPTHPGFKYNLLMPKTLLTNGSWINVEYSWNPDTQRFLYKILNVEYDIADVPENINFAATNLNNAEFGIDFRKAKTIMKVNNELVEGADIKEISSKSISGNYDTPAENYFQGSEVYWGFTGGTASDSRYLPISSIISIGQTPNQSQSPLQLSMEKFGEIGSDEKRQPLAGAKFILQKQDEKTKNWQQVIPDGVSDLKDLVFTTDDSGKIIVSALNEHGVLQKTQQKLIENITANNAYYRFREVDVPNGSSYVQPPTIPGQDPENYVYSGEEPEHSATLFSTAAKLLNGNSTTDDGDFGEVYNNTPPTIELTKSGVENAPLPGVEMTIGAKVTDKTTNQPKVMSLAQLANEVKGTTTYSDITLTTDISGKITLPPDQIPLMMDLASSSLDVYRSLDQWVFIETKAATGYQPSPFLDGNWQDVPDTYKKKFIFNITDNWTSAEDIKSEYAVTAANALNQFTISPEAIGPEDEPLAEASFTINDTPISNPYALTVGTTASAPMYTLEQTKTDYGYVSAQPITFKLVQTPGKINEFTVTVVGDSTDTYFEFYYKVGGEKKGITPGTAFTSSEFLENPTLFLSLVNQPIGEFALGQINPLDYGKISLPQKKPNELIKRQNSDWKVQFTDTRLDAYRTPLKLSVKLDQNFTNTNDPTKTISGILLYRPEEATPITPDDFLIEGEEIPIKEKINPDSGTNDIDWPEQAGFLLQIDDEKQTKIFAGDYQAELTFILSEDPL